MAKITLKEVTKENWLEAIKLAVHPEQERFVPSVAISLAKAYIKPEGETVTPYAIYAEGKMVGFFTYTYTPESADNYWIGGFLIDRALQGQGYGKTAMRDIMEQIPKLFPKCRKVGLTVHPDNHPAQKLYKGFGFKDTGRIYEGEIVYRLEL